MDAADILHFKYVCMFLYIHMVERDVRLKYSDASVQGNDE